MKRLFSASSLKCAGSNCRRIRSIINRNGDTSKVDLSENSGGHAAGSCDVEGIFPRNARRTGLDGGHTKRREVQFYHPSGSHTSVAAPSVTCSADSHCAMIKQHSRGLQARPRLSASRTHLQKQSRDGQQHPIQKNTRRKKTVPDELL